MSGLGSRPDLYVVARLLEALRQEGAPMRRTPLQQRAGVNYTVFARYLDFLAERGLVRTVGDGDGERVELTPRGAEAIRYLTEGIGRVLGIERDRGG